MSSWVESPEAIDAVDAILAGVGLEHGRRATRAGSWKNGERVKRQRGEQKPVKQIRPGKPGVVRVEAWSQHPWLKAGFSTRTGGRSIAYSEHGRGELNLGWTESDSAKNIAANRELFTKEIAGAASMELVTARQFHSSLVRNIKFGHETLSTPAGKAVLRGDALMTHIPGLLLGIQTADCVPVLVADTRRRVVAAFHAGWRGTLKRIVEHGIGSMRLQYGSLPEDLVAAIGPCIGACCFAVGEEVRFDFENQFAYGNLLFTEVYDSDPVRDKYPLLFLTARAPGHSNIGPQIHLDLVEANRRQLLAAGLSAGKISMVGECTACARLKTGSRKYFSHRAEHGYTGRMLSVIGVVAD